MKEKDIKKATLTIESQMKMNIITKFDAILGHILKCMKDDRAAVRTRAVKSLITIIEKDSSILEKVNDITITKFIFI